MAKATMLQWNTLAENTELRHKRVRESIKTDGKIISQDDTVKLLEAVIEPFDKVSIEGDNQKQADFLAKALTKVSSDRINNLHMVQSVVSLPEHLEIFKKGIAKKLDFAFSGPQAKPLAEMIMNKELELGAIHTYLELYSRYLVDLTPRIALIAANSADRNGNLYTGPNSEDTPTIVEATKFKQGIVIAQVNKIVDKVPRTDIPSDWVDYIIETDEAYHLEPLFTRDPAKISDLRILMAMMTIKGIYAKHGIQSLNHGIGYDTAAIELLLPTYGEELGLKGKVCTHWVLNPHPTMIPAIEAGFVKSIYAFGSEIGMEKYMENRSDIFFMGPDGSMRSNRAFAQAAGHYGIDMFIGSTLQIDQYGNSSTATKGMISGFGGAPNMGTNAGGRRHCTDAWLEIGKDYSMGQMLNGPMPNGKKLVVQIVESCRKIERPTFVEKLDAWELAEKADLPLPPVMIYGQDLTHIVTDIGIAYLYRCKDLQERKEAICSIAGKSPLGSLVDANKIGELRDKGIVQYPDDLNIDVTRANKNLLAAKSIEELVEISGGLYSPPARFLKK